MTFKWTYSRSEGDGSVSYIAIYQEFGAICCDISNPGEDKVRNILEILQLSFPCAKGESKEEEVKYLYNNSYCRGLFRAAFKHLVRKAERGRELLVSYSEVTIALGFTERGEIWEQ